MALPVLAAPRHPGRAPPGARRRGPDRHHDRLSEDLVVYPGLAVGGVEKHCTGSSSTRGTRRRPSGSTPVQVALHHHRDQHLVHPPAPLQPNPSRRICTTALGSRSSAATAPAPTRNRPPRPLLPRSRSPRPPRPRSRSPTAGTCGTTSPNTSNAPSPRTALLVTAPAHNAVRREPAGRHSDDHPAARTDARWSAHGAGWRTRAGRPRPAR
jgi:hypothetical protein